MDTELGVGTCVAMHLPRSSAPVRVESSDAKMAVRLVGTATILLVEDDPAVRATTSEMLRDLAYTVIEASTGAAALKVLDDHPLAMVFSDAILPDGMNGPDLAVAIQRLRPELPILLTSGYTAQNLGQQIGSGFALLKKAVQPS